MRKHCFLPARTRSEAAGGNCSAAPVCPHLEGGWSSSGEPGGLTKAIPVAVNSQVPGGKALSARAGHSQGPEALLEEL